MPLHAVEGLLDATSDTEVRREWASLAAAGLPSQSQHQGATNAPHLTLALAGVVPDYVEARIARVLETMRPVPMRLGSLLVMGSRRYVLDRLVVPTPDVPDQVRPGRWTPHVTIARGLGSRQVGDALAVLGRARPLDGTIESVRRWDPDAGHTWQVGGIPT